MTITFNEANALLKTHGQEHVMDTWPDLDHAQQTELLQQIEDLDFGEIERMRKILSTDELPTCDSSDLEPAPVIPLSKQTRDETRLLGEEALRAGEVGVILVAGGQGSRLGFDGPKGCLPLAPISNASLFEIHARKIASLEERYSTQIPFYIMTSRINHAATLAFFEENDFFSLSPDRVICFRQGMWPAMWPDGRLLMDSPGHIFMAPDGHGGTLAALKQNNLFRDMDRRGVKTLFYFQVDNPLVNIAEPTFIGLHREHNADVSVKVCAKRDAQEGLGVVVRRGGHDAVLEYSELTDEQKQALGPDGRLRFLYGSVAIHLFDKEFLCREADTDMPLHVAKKKVPYCDKNGSTITPDSPNARKFEKFIFDVLPDANKCIHVEFAREEEFSPVKNASGEDTPATAQRDMIKKYARWLRSAGVKVPTNGNDNPKHLIEIDPCYASSPDQLVEKLQTDFAITGDTWLK